MRYFVAVAEERSFTRAAARLHLSQQSLSTAVKRLEAQLGTRLLERTSQRVELTAAGAALLAAAPAVLAAMDDAVAAVHASAGELRGAVRLRYGLDSEVLVEERLTAFQAAFPEVAVQGGPGMDADNLAVLIQGEVDAVLCWASAPPGLPFVDVGREQALLAMPDRHRLAALDRVPIAEVYAEPLVLFPRAGAPAVWDLFHGALRDPGRPDVGLQVLPVSGQRLMAARVLQGDGVCPISETLASRLTRPGIVLRPLDPPLHIPLLLVWQRPTAIIAALADHLAATSDDPSDAHAQS